ncbi:MAG: tetratricopeptide repeat protein, partial [Deltaproteobacteria bacterium]|nr:tetratricopeptide repeat protein [Deltaproteobacteria bacterium]
QADLHLHKALQAGISKVNLEPENAAAVYWLGKSYLAAGDTKQARELLQKAVRLQPRSTVYQKELYRLTLEQNGPVPADIEAEG